jgi:hypothetical protein
VHLRWGRRSERATGTQGKFQDQSHNMGMQSDKEEGCKEMHPETNNKKKRQKGKFRIVISEENNLELQYLRKTF